MINSIYEQMRKAGEMVCKVCGRFSSAATCYICWEDLYQSNVPLMPYINDPYFCEEGCPTCTEELRMKTP